MDGCKNYTTLSEADRAQANVVRKHLCDRDLLIPGWYRFQGAAGNRMPDECVLTNRCGTYAPGWLFGAHPTVAEGVVTRQVCYSSDYSCCRWSNNIKVKNCSSYYLYELQKPPRCDLRYCGNAGVGKLHSKSELCKIKSKKTDAVRKCMDLKFTQCYSDPENLECPKEKKIESNDKPELKERRDTLQ